MAQGRHTHDPALPGTAPRGSDNITRQALDSIVAGDDTEASAVMRSAIEEFAQETRPCGARFHKSKAWARTERIVVGGGFRDTRLGELAIARTEIILRDEDFRTEIMPIRFPPMRPR